MLLGARARRAMGACAVFGSLAGCSSDLVAPHDAPSLIGRVQRPLRSTGAADVLTLQTNQGQYRLDVNDQVLYMPDGLAVAVDDPRDLAELQADFSAMITLDELTDRLLSSPPNPGPSNPGDPNDPS